MTFDSLIRSRRSVRKFKREKPDWRDIIECVDATRFAPMAGGNYTLTLILVSEREKIQEIADACQQPFISTAHYVVVACSSPKRTINAYGERGQTYVKQQSGAALQNFLLKIVEKGLATCWVGHFVESLIKEELKIPEDINVEAVFPIGYEAEKPKVKKPKIDLDSILYFEVYGNKKMKHIKKIDA